MNERITFLKEQTKNSIHKNARVDIGFLDVSNEEGNVAIRKAKALKLIFETMPLYIGEKELLVGSRTLYKKYEDSENKSQFNIDAYPKYVNQSDIDYFGFNGQNISKTHYTPDYDIALSKGLLGIINEAKAKKEALDENSITYKDKSCFYDSIIIGYEGIRILIKRYIDYAKELLISANNFDKNDLNTIVNVCTNIYNNPATNLHEACQLLWFTHLALTIENSCFINYGRIDQILYKYLGDTPKDLAQDLITMLIFKFYDMADIQTQWGMGMGAKNDMSGQHNITIGGITPKGENASNIITDLILNALEISSFPEPIVAFRVSKSTPKEILRKACKLAVNGLNVFAFYNDEAFIDSMVSQGLEREYANDYSFDLCQDITIGGKGDFYNAGAVGLTENMLKTLNECNENITSFNEFFNIMKKNVVDNIKKDLNFFSQWFNDIDEYNNGNTHIYLNKIKNKEYSGTEFGQSIMSPLPLTSGMFYGCIEDGIDVARNGFLIKQKGYMVTTPVLAINSLAAIKKNVFDDKKFTLKQVKNAVNNNFKNDEILRQIMLNAPKWGNDDDYVDLIAKEIIEFALNETRKYSINGKEYFSGIHQPHPVPTGAGIMATPDGRFAKMPSPVTLSPENGTMKNGPTAALMSATKINKKLISWNNCVMVSYFSTAFNTENGEEIFMDMLKTYFEQGGTQHQPNVVNVESLKKAQESPDEYKDLVVRLWGVSARFVDITKEMQDELIARLS